MTMRHQPVDGIRLSVSEASGLGERALRTLDYDEEQANAVCNYLIDNQPLRLPPIHA